ncbi:MAG: hypothetical protein ABDH63_06870 [Candidatus Caldarchaeales archaeon]
MTSMATVFSGGVLLFTLVLAAFSVIATMTEHYRGLLEAVDGLREGGRLSPGRLARNSTHILVTLRYEGSDGIPFSQFRSSDLVLRYFSASGTPSVAVMRYGQGWEVVRVGFNGRGELKNPVSIAAGTGIVDPWEELTISIRAPPDMDLNGPVVLELFMPNGVTGVTGG